MCTAAVHLGLQFYNWKIEVQIILLINLACDYPHNDLLVTFFVRNRTCGHYFPRVQFFSTKFLYTVLSVGVASLLENCILEGDEQRNFPLNAFVFLSIVFVLIFLEQSYEWMIELTLSWLCPACEKVFPLFLLRLEALLQHTLMCSPPGTKSREGR